MKDETIHIALCLDNNYVMPASVLLISLFETNILNRFHIHIFSSGLSQNGLGNLEKIIKRYNAEITFYNITGEDFTHFNTNERITHSAYYRLVIPYKVDNSIKRILYMDADIIINGNIKPLWTTNLGDMIVGAIEDVVAIDTKEYTRLKIHEKYGYFNSGVLLINIDKWKDHGITEKVINILSNNYLKFHDQDSLNLTLYDKWKKLSPLWNQQVGTYYCYSNMVASVYPDNEPDAILKKARIIHFNGIEKPWHYASLHPYTELFRYYLQMSGLSLFPEEISIRKKIKKQAYKIFGWRRISRIIYQKQKKLQNEENF
jgi:lipopolysaccharide biosynthesis glycosyltransferase